MDAVGAVLLIAVFVGCVGTLVVDIVLVGPTLLSDCWSGCRWLYRRIAQGMPRKPKIERVDTEAVSVGAEQ